MATSSLDFLEEEEVVTSDAPTMSMEQFATLIAESLAPSKSKAKLRCTR